MTLYAEIARRMRGRLADLYAEEYPEDRILSVIDDCVEDEFTPDTGIALTKTTDENGQPAWNETLTGPQKKLLSLGATLFLLKGELVAAGRAAISMDGPHGRTNTTLTPEAIERAMRPLQEEYDEDLFDLNPAIPVFLDTSIIETARTEADSSGGA